MIVTDTSDGVLLWNDIGPSFLKIVSAAAGRASQSSPVACTCTLIIPYHSNLHQHPHSGRSLTKPYNKQQQMKPSHPPTIELLLLIPPRECHPIGFLGHRIAGIILSRRIIILSTCTMSAPNHSEIAMSICSLAANKC